MKVYPRFAAAPYARLFLRTHVRANSVEQHDPSTLTAQRPDPVERGWDSPTQGPKGRSRAERISRKGPASQSWNGSRPALDRAQRARRAGIFKKLFEDSEYNVTPHPDTEAGTTHPTAGPAFSLSEWPHSLLITIHHPLRTTMTISHQHEAKFLNHNDSAIPSAISTPV